MWNKRCINSLSTSLQGGAIYKQFNNIAYSGWEKIVASGPFLAFITSIQDVNGPFINNLCKIIQLEQAILASMAIWLIAPACHYYEPTLHDKLYDIHF